MDIGLIGLDYSSSYSRICLNRKILEILLSDSSARYIPNVISFTPKETKYAEEGLMKVRSNFNNSIIYPNRYLLSSTDNEKISQELVWQTCQTTITTNELGEPSLVFVYLFLNRWKEDNV